VAQAGADMLGLMFVEHSKRHINLQTAKEISEAIRTLRFSRKALPAQPVDVESGPWFTTHASRLSGSVLRPLLVGVFQDASLATVLHVIAHAQLDAVQLHGSEPIDWAHHIPVPVIRAFHVGRGVGIDGITRGGAHQFLLLDSIREDGSGLSGGSGKTVDWSLARSVVDAGEIMLGSRAPHKLAHDVPAAQSDIQRSEVEGDTNNTISAETGSRHPTQMRFPLPIILAGGLQPKNVSDAIAQVRPWAVDVSGGVETADGQSKDLDKVRAFIANVRGVVEPRKD